MRSTLSRPHTTGQGSAWSPGETEQYFSNIYKYYIAYRLLTDRETKATKAKAATAEKLNASE